MFLPCLALCVTSVFASETDEASQAVFRKGKNLYDQGRYAEAFQEWDAVLPSLEGRSVKRTIEFLKSRVKEMPIKPAVSPTVQVPAAVAVSPAETAPIPAPVIPEAKLPPPKEILPRIQSPAGLKEALKVAEKKTAEKNRASAREAVLFRKEKERTLKIQKEIDSAFEKGKKSLENGKIDQAAAEWDKILPYLEDPSGFKRRIESLRRRERHLAALKVLKQRGQKKSPSVPSADSAVAVRMEALLAESDRRLVARAKEEIESRKSREQLEERKKSEEKARLEKDFESGKTFLAQGDMDRAASAWEKVLSSSESKKAIKAKLEELKETQRRLKKISEITEKKQTEASPEAIPRESQMNQLLLNTAGSLKDEIKELETKHPSKKGPSMTAVSDTRMRKVEIETQPVPGDPRTMVFQETDPGPLEDHEFYLERNIPNPSARKKEAKKRKALESQQAAERKKAWVRSTFEEGRAMYQAGRTREAFLLWDALTPYLAKEPEIRSYIEKATAAVKATSHRV